MKMEEMLKEGIQHPQKIYYLNTTNRNALITSRPNVYSNLCQVYYQVDAKHTQLLSLITRLCTDLDSIEELFVQYMSSALKQNTECSYILLQELISALTVLHPFFEFQDNALRYIQNGILYYFRKTFNNYLIFEDTSANEKNVKDAFVAVMKPTITKSHTDSNAHIDFVLRQLWNEFLLQVTQLSFVSPFIKYRDSEPSVLEPPLILASLYNLKDVLTQYTYVFSTIVKANHLRLSNGQQFSLFISHPEVEPFLRAMDEPQIISKPDLLFQIFIDAMEKRHRDAMEKRHRDAMEKRHRIDNMHIIDTDYNKFEDLSNHIYDELLNISTKIINNTANPLTESDKTERMNSIIDKEWDDILHTEIYEAYNFEQLIYIELFQMVKANLFIWTCSNPNCNNLYVASNNQRTYCDHCSSTRSAADSSYKHKDTELHKIRNNMYNRMLRRIASLPTEDERTKQRKKLTEWRGKSTVLIKEYISSNRIDDVISFKDEVEKLYNSNTSEP